MKSLAGDIMLGVGWLTTGAGVLLGYPEHLPTYLIASGSAMSFFWAAGVVLRVISRRRAKR